MSQTFQYVPYKELFWCSSLFEHLHGELGCKKFHLFFVASFLLSILVIFWMAFVLLVKFLFGGGQLVCPSLTFNFSLHYSALHKSVKCGVCCCFPHLEGSVTIGELYLASNRQAHILQTEKGREIASLTFFIITAVWHHAFLLTELSLWISRKGSLMFSMLPSAPFDKQSGKAERMTWWNHYFHLLANFGFGDACCQTCYRWICGVTFHLCLWSTSKGFNNFLRITQVILLFLWSPLFLNRCLSSCLASLTPEHGVAQVFLFSTTSYIVSAFPPHFISFFICPLYLEELLSSIWPSNLLNNLVKNSLHQYSSVCTCITYIGGNRKSLK